jgi:hypothetical protein
MIEHKIDDDVEGDIVFKRVEGWIHKKGGAVKGSALSAMKNWKKRYFYLENVGSAQKLYELKYYDKPRGNLKGTVKLKGTEVYCDGTRQGNNAKNKKFEFQILLSNGSMLKLFTENSIERDEWVETLNYVITEMKVKPPPKQAKKQTMKNATFDEVKYCSCCQSLWLGHFRLMPLAIPFLAELFVCLDGRDAGLQSWQ